MNKNYVWENSDIIASANPPSRAIVVAAFSSRRSSHLLSRKISFHKLFPQFRR
jgi:hypothetical protein